MTNGEIYLLSMFVIAMAIFIINAFIMSGKKQRAQSDAMIADMQGKLDSSEELVRKKSIEEEIEFDRLTNQYYKEVGRVNQFDPISKHYKRPDSSYYTKKDDSDFLTSAVIGAATDSTILGTLVGGSIAGAVVGDVFFGDSDSEDTLWD